MLDFLKFRQDYFYRYLAGDVALREGKSVSRGDFIIAGSGVINCDLMAKSVLNATMKFTLVVQEITSLNVLNFSTLVKLNSNLTGSCVDRALRKGGVSFNALRVSNSYVCPMPPVSAELVISALSKFNIVSADLNDILELLAVITLAHPFSDGNGRLTRAIFEAVCLRKSINVLSPYIYVLSSDRMDDFIAFLHSYRFSGSNKPHSSFKNDFLDWNNSFQSLVNELLYDVKQSIFSKIIFVKYGAWLEKIMNMFWMNPIISFRTVRSEMMRDIEIKRGFDTLVSCNVLLVKEIKCEMCFVAPDILYFHERLEAKIFTSK